MKYKNYFVIGTKEWRSTVKWSLLTGTALGLMFGFFYLLNVL